jgi:hypothetical protein
MTNLPHFTKLRATRFDRPMGRGLNHPMLIRAADAESGAEYKVVLKCNAGYSSQPLARLRETLSYLLAVKMEIPTPIPVMVWIPEGFSWFVSENAEHAKLLAASEGWNFGTIHLGKSWKQWMKGIAAKKIDPQQIENAFSYDAMVQNADREADNSNLLWKGDQLMVLDFDKAFGYNQLYRSHHHPWQGIIPSLHLPRHCLFRHVKRMHSGEDLIAQKLWEIIEGWKYEENPKDLANLVPAEWRQTDDERLDLNLIMEYVSKLCGNTEDFCRTLTACLRS